MRSVSVNFLVTKWLFNFVTRKSLPLLSKWLAENFEMSDIWHLNKKSSPISLYESTWAIESLVINVKADISQSKPMGNEIVIDTPRPRYFTKTRIGTCWPTPEGDASHLECMRTRINMTYCNIPNGSTERRWCVLYVLAHLYMARGLFGTHWIRVPSKLRS